MLFVGWLKPLHYVRWVYACTCGSTPLSPCHNQAWFNITVNIAPAEFKAYFSVQYFHISSGWTQPAMFEFWLTLHWFSGMAVSTTAYVIKCTMKSNAHKIPQIEVLCQPLAGEISFLERGGSPTKVQYWRQVNIKIGLTLCVCVGYASTDLQMPGSDNSNTAHTISRISLQQNSV